MLKRSVEYFEYYAVENSDFSCKCEVRSHMNCNKCDKLRIDKYLFH